MLNMAVPLKPCSTEYYTYMYTRSITSVNLRDMASTASHCRHGILLETSSFNAQISVSSFIPYRGPCLASFPKAAELDS